MILCSVAQRVHLLIGTNIDRGDELDIDELRGGWQLALIRISPAGVLRRANYGYLT